ncbi:MAG: metallophosphoesterase, partial [Muribaculaceae bacterium]|nr:metallophosphoesterase [Muribaculaceae bacterium]
MNFIHAVACAAMLAAVAMPAVGNDKLVILHTNDTHSHIDPVEATGRGGVLRRKVLIDSVRAKEPNVLLIDAGDIVQGTLYFHLYKGEVEQRMLNELGYDIQIPGNHEFDNGMESLAKMYQKATPTVLSTNYDLSETPLRPYVEPYAIKEYAGKRIGIFAINLDPKGMIADANAKGIKLLDWKTAANATAWHLKHNEKVDAVIAVTHIGYTREPDDKTFVDRDLAAASSDIDIIVGGHSHTRIDPSDPKSPAWRVANADGDSVLVVQTGRYGEYLGEIDLDLDDMTAAYRLIPVDGRLDDRVDPRLDSIIAPYRHGVYSLYNRKVSRVARDLTNSTPGLLNFATDFILERG